MKGNIEDQIDDALIEFLINADSKDIKELLDESYGNSSEIAEKKRKGFINRLKFTSNALVQKKHNDDLLNEVTNILKEAVRDNDEKPIQVLRKTLAEKQTLSFQFRNLEKLSEENIREVLADINLIELLDKLKNAR
ncbi:MAG: hypothetical protein AAFO82_21185 [Bacteroidota bacterium]